MLFLGIDIGSLSCDAALVGEDARLAGWAVVPTGASTSVAVARAREEALRRAGASEADVAGLVSTGYGRDRVQGRLAAVTEISCHARGVRALLPDTAVLVDIGGQDSKAIRIDRDGLVVDFAMNDKCAAGTGRFLEAMARALEVHAADLGSLDEQASGEVTLSSMCTVFAESEVVSRIADGTPVREIVRGLHKAIASRTHALVKRVAPELGGLSVAMSGGVARNRGVVRALSVALGTEIRVPEEPDIVGALGAALIARDRCGALAMAPNGAGDRLRRGS
jgi:predicted CoA-substrate-specific enzyme activase